MDDRDLNNSSTRFFTLSIDVGSSTTKVVPMSRAQVQCRRSSTTRQFPLLWCDIAAHRPLRWTTQLGRCLPSRSAVISRSLRFLSRSLHPPHPCDPRTRNLRCARKHAHMRCVRMPTYDTRAYSRARITLSSTRVCWAGHPPLSTMMRVYRLW